MLQPGLRSDLLFQSLHDRCIISGGINIFATDDIDARNFDADTGTIGTGGSELSIERHFLLDHLRGMSYIGRLYVDPKPAYEPNGDGVRSKQALYPILEPFDLKGVGGLFYRYLDPGKQDDSWLYLPSLRRVRLRLGRKPPPTRLGSACGATRR